MKKIRVLLLVMVVILSNGFWVLIESDRRKKLDILSIDKDYFQGKTELLTSRFEKQLFSFNKVIPIRSLKKKNGDDPNFDVQIGKELLFLIFPASACGICYDSVLSELGILIARNPEKIADVYCITDRSSFNDVRAYLDGFELEDLNILVRREVFDIPLDGVGYPYLFMATLTQQNLLIGRSLIPDKNDPQLTESFFGSLF